MSNHRARKRFGQHFLVDSGVVDRIVGYINPRPDDNLVEIGPGKGAITSLLAAACNHLHIIEIDRDLVTILRQQFTGGDQKTSNVTVHQADALTVDFSSFANKESARIVGNLPYNISTPLIFHLLTFHQCIRDMYFMLQNEVVDRLAAQPGEKMYGRLSVMVQYYCQIDKLFEVPPSCFSPQPKVNSAIVRLTPYKMPPYVATNLEHFSRLVNCVFQQRRKTLHNALKPMINSELIAVSTSLLPVNTRLRPENLSVSDYVMLSNFLLSEKASIC